jgi:hypothetical protein
MTGTERFCWQRISAGQKPNSVLHMQVTSGAGGSAAVPGGIGLLFVVAVIGAGAYLVLKRKKKGGS